MVVALWKCKLPPLLMTLGKTRITTDFDKILTFSLASGFDLDLSVGVTTPLITSVMGIS